MISIIVPVYNTSPYLKSCLDSILSQTLSDWELILVDDASTDGSGQICDEYAAKEERVSVIHQANGGPAMARNRGLGRATGDFIAFVDSDDLLHERYLEILLKVMCDRDADVALSPYVLLSEKDRDKFAPRSSSRLSIKEYSGHEAIEQMLYQCDVHSAPFKLYRRQVLSDKAFPEQFIAYEDLYAMLNIFARSKKVCVVDQPLYFYFKRQDGTLNTWSVRDHGALEVMTQVRAWIRDYDEALLPAVDSREVSLAFNLLRLTRKITSHDAQDIMLLKERCWQIIRRNRKQSLLDPKTRLKNKLALLLSFLLCK